MEQSPIEDDSPEVDAILNKLKDTELHHVSDVERRSAVKRAINVFRAHAGIELQTLVSLINENDRQIGVHSYPDDPQD